MARYLVTGGCGFIGSHLVERLTGAGHGVRVLDDLSTGRRANLPGACELVVGDVADPATVRAAVRGMDGCFHLAAVASIVRCNEDWVGASRVNLLGSVNVFDAARAEAAGGRPVPVVYASSAAVYGDNDAAPLDEAAPARPLTAYGADKLGAEMHARAATRVHGVPTTGLRFFNVYGPRQDPRSPYSGVISVFADRMLKGRPIEIHGDGGQTRDFVFVADVVDFLLAAMDRPADGPEVFNVCTGHAVSVRRLAAALAALCGRAPSDPRRGPARSGDVRTSLGDPSKAEVGLGRRARTGLEDGLRMTLADLRRSGGEDHHLDDAPSAPQPASR